MATIHNLYTLSDTVATRLTPLGIHSGMDITLQNVNASKYVYIGGEGVTNANYGYRIPPNGSVGFELPGKDSLYAIGEIDGLNLAVIKTSLEG